MINPVRNINDVAVSPQDVDVRTRLKRANISEETLARFEKANNPDVPFRQRFREFLRAENDLGKAARILKHGLILLAPWGKSVETITEFGEQVLLPESQQTEKPKMNWLKNRLKEKSTWRGIITVLTVAGVSLSPEQTAAIVTAGVALVGVFEAFFKEPQSEDAK